MGAPVFMFLKVGASFKNLTLRGYIMPTPTVIDKYRFSDVINRRYWDNKYFFDAMNVNPANVLLGGGAAAGASAEVDVMMTNTNAFEYYNIVGNANIGPQLDASFGLNLAADAVSTHGVEYDTGITPQNPFTFLINTNPFAPPINPGNGPNPPPRGFFVKAQFQVATVGGVNPLIVGFRQLAARSQTLNYANFAAIGIDGTAGHIQTITNLASAGNVTTDTTELAVNATVFEVCVFVDAFGNVTYEVNGQPATVSVPYQFLNGITVMPFIRVIQSTTTTATASCNYFECGYQS